MGMTECCCHPPIAILIITPFSTLMLPNDFYKFFAEMPEQAAVHNRRLLVKLEVVMKNEVPRKMNNRQIRAFDLMRRLLILSPLSSPDVAI